MSELLILFFIGLSLSIDTFSVSTCIGIYNLSLKKIFNTSLTVAIFHFIMPLIGVIISSYLEKILNIDLDFILGIILILIALQMFIEYINPSNKDIKLNIWGTIIFAIGVSLDSFSVGLGLKAITYNYFLSSTIFSICSFTLTFIGLSIGKYLNKVFKKYSYLIGALFLLILGIIFIIKFIV